jgi:cell division protein FtsW
MAEGQSIRKARRRGSAERSTKVPATRPAPALARGTKASPSHGGHPAGRPRLRVVRPEEGRTQKRNAAAARRSLFLLLIPAGVLLMLGLIMVLSAGSISAVEGYGTSFWYFQRQLIYAVAGGMALVVAWRLPYSIWKRLAVPMLLATVPLMLIALHPSSGTALYGASRWIDLGPVTLQPSEFMKLALVAFTATVLSTKRNKLHVPMHLLIPLAPVAAVVAGLVILQRDLGTTVILCGSAFLMLFVVGVRGRYLSITAGIGLAGAAVLIFGESYRRTRFIDAWLNPMADAKGAGYQLIQGLIALGSGGWFGVGLGNSRQKWDYLPNAHSDFIFAIIGEELGLIGALFVLAAFAVLLYAGIRIALRAPDTFGRLLATGITSWLGLQIIINLGAVTGLLPITGVPLPLVSFGGTALVVTLAGVGVLASIARCSGATGKVSHARSTIAGKVSASGSRARPSTRKAGR